MLSFLFPITFLKFRDKISIKVVLFMKKNNLKAWLYLLPAFIFLGFFTIYPLVDIFVYSFEENFQFTSEATGIGFGNYNFVLNDEKFLSAVRNTLILVLITVPLSTIIALLISVGLNRIKFLRKIFETIFFLPYVTNTLAVGMVFMLLFNKESSENVGIVNSILGVFGIIRSLSRILLRFVLGMGFDVEVLCGYGILGNILFIFVEFIRV